MPWQSNKIEKRFTPPGKCLRPINIPGAIVASVSVLIQCIGQYNPWVFDHSEGTRPQRIAHMTSVGIRAVPEERQTRRSSHRHDLLPGRPGIFFQHTS